MLVGSYSTAIPLYQLNSKGDITFVRAISEPHINNPSWISVSRSGEYLYAVSEVDNYNNTYSGSVSAYRIVVNSNQTDLDLIFLNEVSSQGAYPCHLAIDDRGSKIFVSNYGSGTLAVIELLRDGSLGALVQLIDHDASQGSHVHQAVIEDGVGHVMDLGLDAVYQYSYDRAATPDSGAALTAVPGTVTTKIGLPEGAGPRHLVIHQSRDIALVLSELDSTLSCFAYNRSTGTIVGSSIDAVSTLEPGQSGADMAAAEIQLSLDGRFVYVSNRDISNPNLNRSSIAVFSIEDSSDAQSCSLVHVQHVSTLGIHPRHFDLYHSKVREGEDMSTLTYIIVANRDSDNIVVFDVNSKLGHINPKGRIFTNPEFLLKPTQVVVL
jgi:6-phosphogluconolactonase